MISTLANAVYTRFKSKHQHHFHACCVDHQNFWEQYPSLIYGIAVLFGCSVAFLFSWALFIAGALFLRLLPTNKRLSACLLMGVAALYAHSLYQHPQPPPEGVYGEGYWQIDSLAQRRSSFGVQWIYQGTLKWFNDERGKCIGKRIPVILSLPDHPDLKRPLANVDYLVKGKLRQTKEGTYVLTPSKEAPLKKLASSWSIAETRFQAKQGVNQWIASRIPSARAASFLGGVSTGDFDDRLLSHELARFGVQHIMAISGFHFGILVAFLGGVLRLFFSQRQAVCGVLFCMTGYFAFVGASPSVLRSWIAIVVSLFGYLIQRKEQPLNSLGFALLIVLIMEPLSCLRLGFQFSFASTAAILLGFEGWDLFLQQATPKRQLQQALHMVKGEQLGYCVLAFCRKSLALTLTVHTVTIPLILFYFGKFPLLSFVYNLFFPFLVSLSMSLLFLAAFLSFLPWISTILYFITSFFTDLLLNLAFHLPPKVDVIFRISSLSSEWVILYTFVCFVLLIVGYQRLRDPLYSPHPF